MALLRTIFHVFWLFYDFLEEFHENPVLIFALNFGIKFCAFLGLCTKYTYPYLTTRSAFWGTGQEFRGTFHFRLTAFSIVLQHIRTTFGFACRFVTFGNFQTKNLLNLANLSLEVEYAACFVFVCVTFEFSRFERQTFESQNLERIEY